MDNHLPGSCDKTPIMAGWDLLSVMWTYPEQNCCFSSIWGNWRLQWEQPSRSQSLSLVMEEMLSYWAFFFSYEDATTLSLPPFLQHTH